MTAQKQNRDNESARAERVALLAQSLERNAQYDGVMLGHYLGRVIAKRLFKAGV